MTETSRDGETRTLQCNMLVGKTRFVGTVTLVRDDARREEIVDMWTRFLAENLLASQKARMPVLPER